MSNSCAYELIDLLLKRGERVAIAESCTGGRVLAQLTAVPGSSAVLWGGVVSYSNESKVTLLGVETDLIGKNGAVSPEVAIAMARGIQRRSKTDWAVAVTGIAGPSGGSIEKPVGTIWVGCCDSSGNNSVRLQHFDGDRSLVQKWATEETLKVLLEMVDNA
ncbi:CinA family protein [Olavius algarvensis spirochete endosymbiont]|uniref:CinA family protein n=1 Tax=Olavius algarvensis spirochete endosymbiont TaxID=260710 RepID=UPI0027D2965D|nr:CinA family protein [Olavius algarvensis spirochete endosymbiont]